MRTVAATGIGGDTPPESPRHFPLLAAAPAHEEEGEEEKRGYRADNEDEDESEVDNSFDYIPVSDLVASESSEDFRCDDATQDGGTQREIVKEVLLGTNGDVAMEAADAEVLQKVDGKHHNFIQDTNVVKKGEASDNAQQENKLMVVTVRTSTAVIDQVASSTLRAASTQKLGVISSDNSKYDGSEEIEVLKAPDEPEVDVRVGAEDVGLREEGEFKTPPKSSSVEHEEAGDAMEVEPEEDIVSETPPSGEVVQRNSDDPHQHEEKQQSASLAPLTAGSTPKKPALSKAKAPSRPTKTDKRKQDLQQPSEHPAASGKDEAGLTTPAKTVSVAPVHTPKRSKQATVKKRKKPPTPLHGGNSDDIQSPRLRRSSRIKNEPPKFTYPVHRLDDEAVMTHFDRYPVGAASLSTSSVTCKYCGKEMTASRGMAKRHLNACLAYASHEQTMAQLDLESKEKPARPSTPSAATSDVHAPKSEVATGQAAGSSDHITLITLMGSEILAAKLTGEFNGDPFVGHAPISRFQEVIRDDVTGLHHLRVQDLLDAVSPLDEPVVQLHPKLPGVHRSTGQHQLEPVSIAKARDIEHCPLRFPAPRSVAEIFIVPLARELGLEYAMREHSAKLVSCPQEGTLLDWQLHQTETVVFLLRGKALWNAKKSQVEYPLQCFHPESWSLDDVAPLAKTHRVASMDRTSVGFLAPPGEDVDVFDEIETVGGVAEHQQEFLTNPGSVVYLPAGVWFEVETHDPNVLWLEVKLAAKTYEDLVFSALKQLAWGDKQWRMRVQLYPDNRNHAKEVRHHVEACIKSLRTEVVGLEGSDLLPEYLITSDLHELVEGGLIQETRSSSASRNLEVDLTNPRFKLKHAKIFRDAAYRVNPVAVLMSADEIPHLSAPDEEDQVAGEGHAAGATLKPYCALKKTPKLKQNRKRMLRVITHTGKHTYMLDEMFGNDKFQSELHVKFQCFAEQSRMVEWLRYHDSEPFDLDEFIRGGSSPRHDKSPTRGEESARNLLRFLYFVGYVSQVKYP